MLLGPKTLALLIKPLSCRKLSDKCMGMPISCTLGQLRNKLMINNYHMLTNSGRMLTLSPRRSLILVNNDLLNYYTIMVLDSVKFHYIIYAARENIFLMNRTFVRRNRYQRTLDLF